MKKGSEHTDGERLITGNEMQTSPPFRKYGWFVHVIAWAILCVFPLILWLTNKPQQTVTWDFYIRFLIMLSSIIVVFYINYLYLVNRFLFTKKTWLFICYNLLLTVAMVLFVHLCMELLPAPVDRIPHPGRPPKEYFFVRFFVSNMMIYIFTAALSVAFRSTTSWYTAEASRKELERSRSEAELQNLKNQLNPHFLFNTLNNIYSLIAISQERAQEAVHDLSRLLRYVMHDSSQPLVSLEKELDFIRNYVELMRIRLPEHVKIDTAISAEAPQTRIAPLLFISLIENAFKHGVSNNKPSFIGLDIRQEKDEVICIITNSYFPKDIDKDKSGSGIGLPNLRKRLELLYPGKYELHCGREGENYRAYLSIVSNGDKEKTV